MEKRSPGQTSATPRPSDKAVEIMNQDGIMQIPQGAEIFEQRLRELSKVTTQQLGFRRVADEIMVSWPIELFAGMFLMRVLCCGVVFCRRRPSGVLRHQRVVWITLIAGRR